MLINSMILAVSCNVDALGIGITYGIKNTKLPIVSKIVLFIFALISGIVSVNLGNFLKTIFPEVLTKVLGSILLVCLGLFVVFKSIKDKNKEENSFDRNNDNSIGPKEAFFLALAVSLDNFCIGISGSIIGVSSLFFPLLVSVFHILSISLGNFLGSKINKKANLPEFMWSIISGSLLVLIGIIKIFI